MGKPEIETSDDGNDGWPSQSDFNARSWESSSMWGGLSDLSVSSSLDELSSSFEETPSELNRRSMSATELLTRLHDESLDAAVEMMDSIIDSRDVSAAERHMHHIISMKAAACLQRFAR